jgi:hypothetical protein
MIETTFIKLETAAEMLGTTKETLLIAAIESRIQINGLLGQYICIQDIQWDDPYSPSKNIVDIIQTNCFIGFVDLFAADAAYLIKNLPVHPYVLSRPDDDNRILVAHFESDIDEKLEPEEYKKAWAEWLMTLVVTPDMLFMRREDVLDMIESHKTPGRNSVKDKVDLDLDVIRKPPKDKTLLSIIAAMLDQLHLNPDERGLPV